MTYTSVINILLTHFSDFENGLFKGIEALLNISTAPITNTTKFNYIYIYGHNARKEIFTMKLVFKKSNLTNAVNIVLKAVPSKTTMSILECILIDASTNEIKFTANDMELGIETLVEGEIIEKGKIAIDAKIFSEIVRKLPDSEITISTDNNYQMLITCEKAKFNIAGKSGEDFSYLPMIEKDKFIYLSQFTLKEIIRQTIFSIADNDNNKIMTGELFEVNGNELKVVSLDGHRISIRKVELKDSFDKISAIVPGKTLTEICKILNGGNDDEVRIFFTMNHIVFEFDNTVVVSRLIEGEYFKINQMLSSDMRQRLILIKKSFLIVSTEPHFLSRRVTRNQLLLQFRTENLNLRLIP